jgi:hypothetical protein
MLFAPSALMKQKLGLASAFSLGRFTSKVEIDRAAEAIAKALVGIART